MFPLKHEQIDEVICQICYDLITIDTVDQHSLVCTVDDTTSDDCYRDDYNHRVFKLIQTLLSRLDQQLLWDLMDPRIIEERRLINLTVQAANLAIQNQVSESAIKL